MTITDELAALIATDLNAHIATRRTSNLNDYASFNINYDLMRIATAELAASLLQSTDPDFRYYYSDSTHDELRNPAQIIDDCRRFFDADYDDDFTALIDFAPLIADNIDYLLDLELDELHFDTIAELATYIAAAAS